MNATRLIKEQRDIFNSFLHFFLFFFFFFFFLSFSKRRRVGTTAPNGPRFLDFYLSQKTNTSQHFKRRACERSEPKKRKNKNENSSMSLAPSSFHSTNVASTRRGCAAAAATRSGRPPYKKHAVHQHRDSKRRFEWKTTGSNEERGRRNMARASREFTSSIEHNQEPTMNSKKKYISSVATHSTSTSTSTSAEEMFSTTTEEDNVLTTAQVVRIKNKLKLNNNNDNNTHNKQKWWEKYQSTSSQPRNLILVKNIDEFLSYLYASATMIHRDIDNHSNSIDEDVEDEEKSSIIEQILERKSPLVVVKYFREDCPACRSVHPKFAKIAEREFSNVLFLKVNLSEFSESFAEDMNVHAVPHVQVYNGAEGLVSEFSLNLMPKSLRNFRNILGAYTSCADNLPKRETQGPASILSAAGWPGYYRGQMKNLVECKRNFWRFRRAEQDAEEDS